MLKERLQAINSFVNTSALAIVIIIFCGIFVFPMFYKRKHVKEVKAEMLEIGNALEKFYAESGKWPSPGGRGVAGALTGEGDQKSFSTHPRRDGEGRFIDPWEYPYRYFFSKDGYAIQSAGRDGEFADGVGAGEDDYWYSPR